MSPLLPLADVAARQGRHRIKRHGIVTVYHGLTYGHNRCHRTTEWSSS